MKSRQFRDAKGWSNLVRPRFWITKVPRDQVSAKVVKTGLVYKWLRRRGDIGPCRSARLGLEFARRIGFVGRRDK